MKFCTNTQHHQMMCREEELSLCFSVFTEWCCFVLQILFGLVVLVHNGDSSYYALIV